MRHEQSPRVVGRAGGAWGPGVVAPAWACRVQARETGAGTGVQTLVIPLSMHCLSGSHSPGISSLVSTALSFYQSETNHSTRLPIPITLRVIENFATTSFCLGTEKYTSVMLFSQINALSI